jgi:hypothetical protein
MSCTGFLRGLWHRVKRPQQSHRMYSCTVAMIDGVDSDGVRFVEMQLNQETRFLEMQLNEDLDSWRCS